MAFRISGTLYRVTITGSGTFNAAGVFGRLQVRGKGTLNVSGARSSGTSRPMNFGKVPRDVRKLFQIAVTGAPVPLRPLRAGSARAAAPGDHHDDDRLADRNAGAREVRS